MKFPHKYQGKQKNFGNYCRRMAHNGTPGSHRELQAISDIFFILVEIYSSKDFLVPMTVIKPLRLSTVSPKYCTKTIRLWKKSDVHCVALVYQPL